MAPVVVELAHVRCPDLPPATVAAFAVRIARPVPDVTDDAGKKWVSARAMQEGIDRRDEVIHRMGRAGTSVVDAYEACRQQQAAKQPQS